MYIWELPDWPHFRWDQAELTPLLAQARHDQGRLLGRMEALGFPLREEAVLRTLTQDVLKSRLTTFGKALTKRLVVPREGFVELRGRRIFQVVAAEALNEAIIPAMPFAKDVDRVVELRRTDFGQKPRFQHILDKGLAGLDGRALLALGRRVSRTPATVGPPPPCHALPATNRTPAATITHSLSRVSTKRFVNALPNVVKRDFGAATQRCQDWKHYSPQILR